MKSYIQFKNNLSLSCETKTYEVGFDCVELFFIISCI
jgi:hypothetical protein